uniref:PQQ-binding-like beta-propeller repeat protein n=1 Tax=Acerihabitans arboris TaxID=2691583 RepID=UPI0015B62132|nr:PQQ-binding-like beta-propeller repeat protein [Acerihabitans arboris]
MAYIPLGNAKPDYHGAARRPFDNTYSSALVALDIETGKARWHFWTVHHDAWDFDLPIGPSLIDLPSPDGGSVHTLVQTTKMGQLFLLDRATGKPLAEAVDLSKPRQGIANIVAHRQSSVVLVKDIRLIINLAKKMNAYSLSCFSLAMCY